MRNIELDLSDPRTVKPAKAIILEHRASFLERFPDRSLFVAAARQGMISFFDLSGDEAETRARILPGVYGTMEAISAHPTEPRIALIEDGALVVIDLDGNRLLRESAGSGDGKEGVFTACLYDPCEPYLWCVVRRSPESVEIQLRDRDNGVLRHHDTQEDPYSDSRCSLSVNSPSPGVSLWLAAGQDGQQIYWLRLAPEGIVCREEPLLEDTTVPVFSPSGDEFLALSEGSLYRYAYPSLELLGVCSSPWGEAEFNSCCYLSEERGLASSSEDRLFVIDLPHEGALDDGTDAIEVFMEGHEPQTVSVYYPSLTGDSGLCTDITGFTPFGDWILAQFRRDREAEPEAWKDTVLCLPVAAF